MSTVESGARAQPEKKPAMPTTAKACGCRTSSGHHSWKICPMAEPRQPPITIEGPNTPPEPPELIVRLVVRIFSRATVTSRGTATLTLLPRLFWSVP